MMRKISKAAVDTWGLEAQMFMVGEEAGELSDSIFKWRRAWKKYNKVDAEMNLDERKAIQRAYLKAVKHVQKEAMQVTFMIDQLKVLQPEDYESILEEVLADCTQRLTNRGVKILEAEV